MSTEATKSTAEDPTPPGLATNGGDSSSSSTVADPANNPCDSTLNSAAPSAPAASTSADDSRAIPAPDSADSSVGSANSRSANAQPSVGDDQNDSSSTSANTTSNAAVSSSTVVANAVGNPAVASAHSSVATIPPVGGPAGFPNAMPPSGLPGVGPSLMGAVPPNGLAPPGLVGVPPGMPGAGPMGFPPMTMFPPAAGMLAPHGPGLPMPWMGLGTANMMGAPPTAMFPPQLGVMPPGPMMFPPTGFPAPGLLGAPPMIPGAGMMGAPHSGLLPNPGVGLPSAGNDGGNKSDQNSGTVAGIRKGNWQSYITEDGGTYYYNVETKETTWEVPPVFEDDMGQPIDPKTGAPIFPKPEELRSDNDLDDDEPDDGHDLLLTTDDSGDTMMGSNREASLDGHSHHPNSDVSEPKSRRMQLTVVEDSIRKKSLAEAESRKNTWKTDNERKEAFFSLLTDKVSDMKMQWNRVLPLIISDKRYGAISKVSEKKRLLLEWQNSESDRRRKSELEKSRRMKDDFNALLESRKAELLKLKWRKVEPMIEEESVVKDAIEWLIEEERRREDDCVSSRRRRKRSEEDMKGAVLKKLRYWFEQWQDVAYANYKRERDKQRQVSMDELNKYMRNLVSQGVITENILYFNRRMAREMGATTTDSPVISSNTHSGSSSSLKSPSKAALNGSESGNHHGSMDQSEEELNKSAEIMYGMNSEDAGNAEKNSEEGGNSNVANQSVASLDGGNATQSIVDEKSESATIKSDESKATDNHNNNAVKSPKPSSNEHILDEKYSKEIVHSDWFESGGLSVSRHCQVLLDKLRNELRQQRKNKEKELRRKFRELLCESLFVTGHIDFESKLTREMVENAMRNACIDSTKNHHYHGESEDPNRKDVDMSTKNHKVSGNDTEKVEETKMDKSDTSVTIKGDGQSDEKQKQMNGIDMDEFADILSDQVTMELFHTQGVSCVLDMFQWFMKDNRRDYSKHRRTFNNWLHRNHHLGEDRCGAATVVNECIDSMFEEYAQALKEAQSSSSDEDGKESNSAEESTHDPDSLMDGDSTKEPATQIPPAMDPTSVNDNGHSGQNASDATVAADNDESQVLSSLNEKVDEDDAQQKSSVDEDAEMKDGTNSNSNVNEEGEELNDNESADEGEIIESQSQDDSGLKRHDSSEEGAIEPKEEEDEEQTEHQGYPLRNAHNHHHRPPPLALSIHFNLKRHRIVLCAKRVCELIESIINNDPSSEIVKNMGRVSGIFRRRVSRMDKGVLFALTIDFIYKDQRRRNNPPLPMPSPMLSSSSVGSGHHTAGITANERGRYRSLRARHNSNAALNHSDRHSRKSHRESHNSSGLVSGGSPSQTSLLKGLSDEMMEEFCNVVKHDGKDAALFQFDDLMTLTQKVYLLKAVFDDCFSEDALREAHRRQHFELQCQQRGHLAAVMDHHSHHQSTMLSRRKRKKRKRAGMSETDSRGRRRTYHPGSSPLSSSSAMMMEPDEHEAGEVSDTPQHDRRRKRRKSLAANGSGNESSTANGESSEKKSGDGKTKSDETGADVNGKGENNSEKREERNHNNDEDDEMEEGEISDGQADDDDEDDTDDSESDSELRISTSSSTAATVGGASMMGRMAHHGIHHGMAHHSHQQSYHPPQQGTHDWRFVYAQNPELFEMRYQ